MSVSNVPVSAESGVKSVFCIVGFVVSVSFFVLVDEGFSNAIAIIAMRQVIARTMIMAFFEFFISNGSPLYFLGLKHLCIYIFSNKLSGYKEHY